MWLIGRFKTDTAHQIRNTRYLLTKKCANDHGHTYHIEFRIPLALLQKHYRRKFVDFHLIKRDVVEPLEDLYDHNDITAEYGISTVEQYANEIKLLIMMTYDLSKYHVYVQVFETDKWGVET